MLIESKSNLAKLLATENVLVEQRNVPTAYFNLKDRTLVIPTLKDNFSSDLFDLFIGHEVGHALHTPEQGWHDSIVDVGIRRSILNVCEDVRIEKLIRRKYPGLKWAFVKAYNKLIEMDFFEIEGKDINEMKFVDRLNLHAKCGVSLNVQFHNETELELLHEAENTETWEEVVEVSKKIQEYTKSEVKDKKAEQKVEYDEDEDEEELAPGDDEGNDSLGGNSDDGVDDESTDEFESQESSELDSDTDNSFRENEKSLYKNDRYSKEKIYGNIPKLPIDQIIVDYKELYAGIRRESDKLKTPNDDYYSKFIVNESNFQEFRKQSLKTVSYLVKEFELRRNADQLKRASISKTGELNMDKIFSYRFSEDIFKKLTVVPNGKSHGLVMFLDWSGSMDRVLHDTIKQLLTLVLFCKKVMIPFEVYAFTDRYGYTNNNGRFDKPSIESWTKDGDVCVHYFRLMNIFSSRMNSRELSYAASAMLSKIYMGQYCYHGVTLGGTPLNETIIAAMDIIPEFRKKYKLQVVNTVFMTDGEGHYLYAVKKKTDNSYSRNIVVRDKVTRAEAISSNAYGNNNSAGYLSLLKQRTGCNLIGFRITSSREVKTFLRNNFNDEIMSNKIQVDKVAGLFRKNNYYTLVNKCFDEWYIIKDDSLDTDEVEMEEVTNTSTKSLVKVFKNYTKNKLENKLVLNSFIRLIS